MATLEDIEVYESLNFASVVSYDLKRLIHYYKQLIITEYGKKRNIQ